LVGRCFWKLVHTLGPINQRYLQRVIGSLCGKIGIKLNLNHILFYREVLNLLLLKASNSVLTNKMSVDGHFESPSGKKKPSNTDRKELANR